MRNIEGSGNNFCNGYINVGWGDFDKETELFKRTTKVNNGHATLFDILGFRVHKEIAPFAYKTH